MASLLSVVFIQQARNQKDNIGGLGWWAAGPMLMLTGSLFLAGRGHIPLWLSIIPSNVLIIAGVAAFYIGLRRFYGFNVSIWPFAFLPLIGLTSYYYTFVDADYRLRLATFAAVVLIFEMIMVETIRRNGEKSFSSRFLLSSMILMILVLTLRIATVFEETKNGDIFVPSLIQNIYLSTYGLVLVAQSVGFMLLYHDRLRQEIEDLANHDFLTGLFSRGAVFKRGLELARLHDTSHQPLSALMFDLDRFKAVNDTWGHIKGDSVLRDFAEVGRANLRETDLFARYGGEEFVAILPNTNAETALGIAEQIRNAQGASQDPTVTVSVGVATLPGKTLAGEPTRAFEELLNAADKALYLAKQKGRNRSVQAPAPAQGGD